MALIWFEPLYCKAELGRAPLAVIAGWCHRQWHLANLALKNNEKVIKKLQKDIPFGENPKASMMGICSKQCALDNFITVQMSEYNSLLHP